MSPLSLLLRGSLSNIRDDSAKGQQCKPWALFEIFVNLAAGDLRGAGLPPLPSHTHYPGLFHQACETVSLTALIAKKVQLAMAVF